jgi:hypothetical protein
MRQVFFKTVSALQAAAGTAGDARFNDLTSGELGFWTLDAATGGDWFAGNLFTQSLSTIAFKLFRVSLQTTRLLAPSFLTRSW